MNSKFDQDAFVKAALAHGKQAPVSQFIDFVRAHIAQKPETEKLSILGNLISAYQVALSGETFDQTSSYRFEQAEALLREMTSIAPDDAYNWIALAEHFHYYAVDLKKARSTVEIAIQKALAEGNFVRQAYGILIRIALAEQDYDTVEKSLAALTNHAVPTGNADVALEWDFLRRIPAGTIGEEVRRRYQALLDATSKDQQD